MASGARAPVERRLAAIFAADIAGYSRLMGADEEGTLAALKAVRGEVADPRIAEHRGRIVKTTGDGLLVEFPSVVDAVRCAVDMQRGVAARNVSVPDDKRIEFRIGINLGDIIIEDGDIFGDGVNVAARLEALADPGGICVSRVVRDQVCDRLDVAFDDLGAQQVKNIARSVHVYRVRLAPPQAAASAPQLPLPEKPSLAVLPFQNMSGDPEQEYFADGMVEEITTAISRLPWLFVIARNSAFTYKGRAVDVKQVARELGVRYVLEGSVRKSGNRVRITGQLIDTATGAHIWANRFDGALDDIFELQDQVASSVAGAIEPRLRQSEIERAVRKPTERLDADDLYLRALAELQKPGSDPAAAIALAKRALGIDPGYAPAAGLAGWAYARKLLNGIAMSEEEIAEGLTLARHAIAAGADDPDALWSGGGAVAMLSNEHGLAMNAIQRAIALNPNNATAWGQLSNVCCYANHPEEAIAAARQAQRLSPLDPQSNGFHWSMGYALMLAGRYDEALDAIDRSLLARPNFHAPVRGRISVCGYLGRTEEAREWIARLRQLNPNHTIVWFRAFGSRFLSPGTLAIWVEGFRRAGMAGQ